MPTDWEDTPRAQRRIGDYVTIVRKERGGDDWYLGSVTDEVGAEARRSLDFLDPDRSYVARIYRDADDADWKTNAHSIVIETRQATHGDVWELALAPGGGQAIRFVAAPPAQ